MDPGEALELVYKALASRRKSERRELLEKLAVAGVFLRGHVYRLAYVVCYGWVGDGGLGAGRAIVSRAGSYVIAYLADRESAWDDVEGLIDSVEDAVHSMDSLGELDLLYQGEAAAVVESAAIDALELLGADLLNALAQGIVVGVDPDSGKLFVHPIPRIVGPAVYLLEKDLRAGVEDAVRAVMGFRLHRGEWGGGLGFVRLQGDLALNVYLELASWEQAGAIAKLAWASWAAGSSAVSAAARGVGDAASTLSTLSKLNASSPAALAGLRLYLTTYVMGDALGLEPGGLIFRDAVDAASSVPRSFTPRGYVEEALSDAIADLAVHVASSRYERGASDLLEEDAADEVEGLMDEIARAAGLGARLREGGEAPPGRPCTVIENALAKAGGSNECPGGGRPVEAVRVLASTVTPQFAAGYYASHLALAAAILPGRGSSRPLEAFNATVGSLALGGFIASIPRLDVLVAVASARLARDALRGSGGGGLAWRLLRESLGEPPEPSIVKASVGDHEVAFEGIALTGRLQRMFRSFRALALSLAIYRAAETARREGSLRERLEALRSSRSRRAREARIAAGLALAHLLTPRLDPLPAIIAPGSTLAASHPEHGSASLEVDKPILVEVSSLITPSRPNAMGLRIVRRDLEEFCRRLDRRAAEAIMEDLELEARRAGNP